jgi:glycosyltransferase involved in cell wall biosynthesis
VNILFVNYGDFTTNSLNHIAGFARALGAAGHAAAVAVPQGRESLAVIPDPRFIAVTYAEALARPALFPDGRPADLVHAWTPREVVRKFVLAYQAHAHARLVVHLEDNEEHLLASWLRRPPEALRDLTELELAQHTSVALPHPRRYRHFLRAADGVTVIVESLRRFVPAGLPCALLEPGVDFSLYHPRAADPALRRQLGLREAEKVVVFTGSNTFANEAEMRDLYRAVARLNAQGRPTRLVRTGVSSASFQASLSEAEKAFVLDLGFIPKGQLPGLLAQADVLVQPGAPGPFNDFRLPSKLPEFLSMGRPVVLPAANLGLGLRDGADAIVLRTGAPEEIAAACARVFGDPALARTLGENAVAVARRRFDLAANARGLAAFYEVVRAAPPHPGSTAAMVGDQTELSLALQGLAARTSDPEAADLAADLAPLVQALERQDIAQAERVRLEREIALTHQHASNLTREITAARKRLPRLEESLRLTKQHAANLEQLRHSLQRRLRELDRQCAHLTRTIGRRDEGIARRDGLIDQRDGKIRAMQESFSWKVTMPLRYLRRRFLDPQSPAAPAPAVEAVAPAIPPAEPVDDPVVDEAPGRGLRHSIDLPQSWNVLPGKIQLRGWCYAEDGRQLAAVRAILPDRTVEGTYGLRRPDVAASAPGSPAAEFSGWQIALELTPADTRLDLEVADANGLWHAFVQTDLQVGAGLAPLDIVSYDQWIEAYDTLTVADLQAQIDRAAALAYQPLISVLLPVYNTPDPWLQRAIDSVRAQTYSNWELCIADDASTEPAIPLLLQRAAAADRRIRVVRREQNGHIAAASNSALALATGDFIALLDHDDELAPNALFEVATALNADPDAGYLYSDEDKIDENGRRHTPNCKPDWLPDLFDGQNYTSHLSVYRAALIREVGAFRPGFEGSQDWDLTLRVIERIAPEHIVHLPRILYHWRAVPGSTALLLSEKDYPALAARKALAEHFSRLGQAVEILPVPGGHWRIKYPLPGEPPLVSLVIPTRNGRILLQRCLDSILDETTYPRFEIIVVDNGSDDPDTLAYFATLASGSDPRLTAERSVRILRHEAPFNYSAINNRAVRDARGELVGLLNNDLEVITPGWLDEMAAQALRPGIGCVGAMLYYPDDTVQHAGCVLGIGGVAGHAFKTHPRGTEGVFNRGRLVQNYSAVTAACLVVRKAIYEQVGGFDEQALAVAFNDVDFCLKVRQAGYRNLWTPFAEFYHHESASRGADDTPEKAGRFRAEVEMMLGRWGPLLRQDPAYNPNLSLEDENFSLASPPRTPLPP